MNKSLILETVRSWADNRFTDAAGEREVSERGAPPPFVDVRAGLPDTRSDVSGILFGLQAEPDKSLQIWISADALGTAYAFMDESDPEVNPNTFSAHASPAELIAKLNEIADLFMRTLIFEPTLDEWVHEQGGSYKFERLAEFSGEAGNFFFNSPEEAMWTFFRYRWPGSEEVEVLCGFNGSGVAATFSESMDGWSDFDQKIEGLQNASQLRVWLDKAVARPAKMSIREIGVTKLFGKLTYIIPLKFDHGATIIHAPNGCGKTTILRLVYALLNGQFRELALTRFESLVLCFDDGRRLVVEQMRKNEDSQIFEAEQRRRKRQDGLMRASSETGATDNDLSVSDPCNGLLARLYDAKNNLLKEDSIAAEEPDRGSSLRLRNFAMRIAQREPSLRIHRNGAVDASTGEFLSFAQIVERYRGPQFSEAKPWLLRLLARNEVYFIQTDRLEVEVEELMDVGRPLPREEVTSIPAVVQDAKQIAGLINKTLTDFSHISQQLDRDFPQQLIDALKGDAPDFKAGSLEDLEEKYGRIVAAGILDKSEAHGLRAVSQTEAEDPTVRRVLSLYAKNQSEKLRVFEGLLSKIETLKKVINDRLQMKNLEVSSADGYRVVSEDGSIVPLHRLSSGEQHQIVLFHSLVFGMRPGALIMIDEPEISLHVAWQEMFLRDLELIAERSGVHFLIATHSPLIIGNRWNLTVGLGEQISEAK
jgi:predicted ATP-binding protein involved in virulence